MNWLVDPIGGFRLFESLEAPPECSGGGVLNECSCTAGLVSCGCKGCLVALAEE